MKIHDPVREFIRAFNERDLDAFVAVLDPEVELHSMKGVRKGTGGGAGLGDAAIRAGCSRRSSWRSCIEEGTESGGGSGAGADPARLALGRGRLARDRPRRWPGCSSCATTGCGAGGRLRTARRCMPAGSITASGRAYHPVDGVSRRVQQGGDRGLERAAVRPFRAVPRPGCRRASGAHGERAMEVHPPRPGDRVLDVGCGFGDTTQRLAELVGPRARRSGSTSPSRSSSWPASEAEGVENVRFACARRPGGRARAGLRLRLLADGDHVLRQPGAGAPQHARGAGSGRAVLRGRLASQARQRLGAPRRAGRRGVPRASGGDRRADLRSGTVLDGQRRHP